MKIFLHNEYKIINLWYPTYVYQFFNFPYNYKNRVLACFQTRPHISGNERKMSAFQTMMTELLYAEKLAGKPLEFQREMWNTSLNSFA